MFACDMRSGMKVIFISETKLEICKVLEKL